MIQSIMREVKRKITRVGGGIGLCYDKNKNNVGGKRRYHMRNKNTEKRGRGNKIWLEN